MDMLFRPRRESDSSAESAVDAMMLAWSVELRPRFLEYKKMASKNRKNLDAILSEENMLLRPKHGNES